MKVIKALGLKEPILITLIGGGGKTTTLFKLGEELVLEGESVLLSTTTAMLIPPPSAYDLRIITKDVNEAKRRVKENVNARRILLGREIIAKNKIKGFAPYEMDEIYKENKNRYFLVEGDGSNGRSLKIPDVHEPQVPLLSSITIIVIGADILGKEINPENVHRPHLIQGIIQKCGNIVDKNLLLDLISQPLGITKGIPENSKKVILFNKIKSSDQYEYIYNLSEEIISKNKYKDNKVKNYKVPPREINRILLGEMQDTDPILAVLGEEE